MNNLKWQNGSLNGEQREYDTTYWDRSKNCDMRSRAINHINGLFRYQILWAIYFQLYRFKFESK